MTLDLHRIRALCFDVDGTLSDTDDLWVKRIETLLSPVKFLFPQRKVQAAARWVVMGLETPGNLAYTLLDWMKLDDEMGRLFNFLAKRRRKPPHQFWMIPRIDFMLQQLKEKYPLSVVSARDRESTLAFLEHFQFSHCFKAVATSQTCLYTKPFPDPIRWAAERMGVSPDECLMVGDTVVDIRAGKAAGAQTVGVLCGFGTEKELRRAGADLIIETTAELLEILDEKPAVIPG